MTPALSLAENAAVMALPPCELCHEPSPLLLRRGDEFFVCDSCAASIDKVGEAAYGDVMQAGTEDPADLLGAEFARALSSLGHAGEAATR